jgi:hydrogenase maturation protease
VHLVRDPLPDAERHPKLRVCCVGNRWRADDAFAIVVGERLQAALAGEAEVDLHEGEPTALIDTWGGADVLWVVDSVSSGAQPGTVHRFDASVEPVPAELFRTSTHHVSLAEAVELARALGQLPRRVVVVGVEGELFAVGEELSPRVAEAVDPVVDLISQEVRACTKRL